MKKGKKKTKKISKNRVFGAILAVILVFVIGIGIYYFLTVEDEESSLTLLEKQWIESNKTTLVDIQVPNNLGVIADSGTGVVFDFLTKVEQITGLTFNKKSYNYPEYIENDKELSIVTISSNMQLKSNDIFILEDPYIVLSTSNTYLSSINSLIAKKIGVLQEDNDIVKNYMSEYNTNVISYSSYDALKTALINKTIDYIIIPRFANFDNITNSSDIYTSYNLSGLSNKIVLRLGNTDRLNNIISKILEIWLDQDYQNDLEKSLMSSYVKTTNMTSLDKSSLTNKVYKYGYIKNDSYNMEKSGRLYGVSGEYINTLINMTDMDFEYISYNNNQELIKDLSSGKLDIAYINFLYTNESYLDTSSPYDETFVALSKNYKNIDSVYGLINNKLYIKNNNYLYDYINNNINSVINPINNYNDRISTDGIIIVDGVDYLYQKNTTFADYKYLFSDSFNGNYHFVVKNNNEVLYNLFNFVLNNTDYNEYKTRGLNNILGVSTGENNFKQIYIIILAVIFIPIIIVLLGIIIMKNTKKLKISKKEDFLKYNDMLTNLKNRNYLNINIDKWDDTKIYPKTVIIIDLNNLKYVNDNYGHEEGNNLIKKAAAILINTQLEKSDIVRTDGNEFLIYLIGYSKSQISTYISKLSKEFENLPHGFGAAIGYSMIDDEIKTVDDAINEATIEMRNDKEQNYK